MLIQKRHNFEAGTNFIAWVLRIANFKATTWRRDAATTLGENHGARNQGRAAGRYAKTTRHSLDPMQSYPFLSVYRAAVPAVFLWMAASASAQVTFRSLLDGDDRPCGRRPLAAAGIHLQTGQQL